MGEKNGRTILIRIILPQTNFPLSVTSHLTRCKKSMWGPYTQKERTSQKKRPPHNAYDYPHGPPYTNTSSP